MEVRYTQAECDAITSDNMSKEWLEAKVKLLMSLVGLDDDYLDSVRVKFPDRHLIYSREAVKFLKDQFDKDYNNSFVKCRDAAIKELSLK